MNAVIKNEVFHSDFKSIFKKDNKKDKKQKGGNVLKYVIK